MNIPYILIRSKRRTLSIQIDTIGRLIARAPIKLSIDSIEDFIVSRKEWIEKYQAKQNAMSPNPVPDISDIKEQINKLKEYIIPRVHELWEGKNLPPITSIKITASERRWGSCSGKNGLCFSYRLYGFLGSPFIDAIIIHELAHLREKNHQKPFWDLVNSWMPEYDIIIKAK